MSKISSLRTQSNHTLKKTVVTFLLCICVTGIVFAQAPVANFTSNITSGCAPLAVNFTDQSTGNPTSWNWEFSNGTLSSAQNPTVSFANPGTYSVKLVVQNADGIAQVERIDYITVFPSPNPNFTANITLGCVPTTVQFTDHSTTPSGSITSWDWDFGDGSSSTQQNPSHTYANEGFYTVVLTVRSSSGCSRTITRSNYIRIVGGISTNFSFTPPVTCRPPYSVSFQNQSSGPGVISYNWNFGNGQTSTQQNPTATFNAPGTYTVTLNSTSTLGCTGSIQKTITINSTSTDFTAPTDICLNRPVTFQNASNPAPLRASWSFGDGTVSAQINPVKTFTTPGTYDVKLINEYNNCIDSITKTVLVSPNPTVNIRANDSTYCQAPANVQFTDLTPGAVSWQWDFGDGSTSTDQNPTHQYTAEGSYTVILSVTTASGCVGRDTFPDFIRVQEPVIQLNLPAGGCIPFTFQPTSLVTTIDSVATWQWNLGAPGAIFNVRNPPPYTYTAAGNYDITLTITTVSGCTKTLTVPNGVRTGVPPVVNFTLTPADACASQPITFTDNSITTPGAEVQWEWDFGDGQMSNIRNPSHIYIDTGLLTVTLTVLNNRCEGTFSQTLQIHPPVAGFTHAINCATRQVTFTDTSLVNPGLSPLTYHWEMGDPSNTQFNVQNPPPFTYPGPGTYQVSLTVVNGPCSYTRTVPVTIANEVPAFTANKNPVCKEEDFTLTAINYNPANVDSFYWTVGATTFASDQPTFTHRIATNGSYDVTLSIRDLNGCITTTRIPNYLTVNGPVAGFNVPDATCLNKTVTFSDQSTPAGNIRNWNFDFGDGTTQSFTSAPFTHTYTQAASYGVTLTVTDAAGCTDTYAGVDVLITDPKAGFRTDSFYCPLAPMQFADTSSGARLTYFWDFGDGGTSTLANPTHAYPAGDANYTVKLVVTDISGCKDSVTHVDIVKIRSPKAAFSIRDTTTICPPLRTSFTFEGSDYQSFHWEFGDGGMSTLANPSYFYGGYGTFIPELIVRGPGGCTDTARSSVTVHNPADIRVNYGPVTRACNNLNVDFDLVVPPGFKFIFYFGDGTADSTRRTVFSHFYSKPSLNRPYLVIYDSISGCQNTIFGATRIDVLGAVPLFDVNRREFCDTGTVVFTDFTTKNEPIISTVWSFGDNTTSNDQSPTHLFTQPGTYIVRLDITTQSNCSSSYQDTILVYRTPIPAIVSRDTICINSPDTFGGTIAVPDSVTFWQWNFGNGQTSTSQDNSITYTATGDYTVTLITANSFGCKDTTTKTIYVNPLPTATPVQDPITIIAGGSTPLQMVYTGNISSYTWAPQYRLTCFNCPEPVANPQVTTAYRVQMEDVHGCRNTGSITVNVVCNDKNFFVPNTFSPNGDGRNDVFFPRGSGLYRIKTLLIFNRWGQVVFDGKDFTPNDPSKGWDGTYKGQKASADVYIYTMEIICENNTLIPVKGNITLLR